MSRGIRFQAHIRNEKIERELESSNKKTHTQIEKLKMGKKKRICCRDSKGPTSPAEGSRRIYKYMCIHSTAIGNGHSPIYWECLLLIPPCHARMRFHYPVGRGVVSSLQQQEKQKQQKGNGPRPHWEGMWKDICRQLWMCKREGRGGILGMLVCYLSLFFFFFFFVCGLGI